jgi:four helix bundle protein
MKYLTLKNINAYQVGSELSDYAWEVVSKWEWFAKRTVGIQFIDAVDSIAANITEGFGRFHKKDKQKFYYNSRGSVYESIHWCQKAYERSLITKKQNDHILEELRELPREINSLIDTHGQSPWFSVSLSLFERKILRNSSTAKSRGFLLILK